MNNNIHPVSPGILAGILRKEHTDIGLYLVMGQEWLLGEHYLYLCKRGEKLPVKVLEPDATIEDILYQADQALEWERSGIEFGKEEIK